MSTITRGLKLGGSVAILLGKDRFANGGYLREELVLGESLAIRLGANLATKLGELPLRYKPSKPITLCQGNVHYTLLLRWSK